MRKKKEFENIYVYIYRTVHPSTRTRAHPRPSFHKKGGFLRPFSFLYLQKHAENLPPIAYPLMCVSLVRQYKEENVYPYTLYIYVCVLYTSIYIIYLYIYITYTRALSAHNVYVYPICARVGIAFSW